MLRETFDSEARLSWVLAALAGVLGATAFTHSAGYFVTFMTGNAQRAVLGYFRDDVWLSVTAGLLMLCFVAGVVVASVVQAAFLGRASARTDRAHHLQSVGRHGGGRHR